MALMKTSSPTDMSLYDSRSKWVGAPDYPNAPTSLGITETSDRLRE